MSSLSAFDPAPASAARGRVALAFLLVIVSAVVLAPVLHAQALDVYQVPNKGPGQIRTLIERGYDVIGRGDQGGLLVVGTEADRTFLSSWGAPATRVARAGQGLASKVLDANLGEYHTYAEMQASLTSLTNTYPALAELQTMGTSIEGRDIPVIHITGGVSTARVKPEVLLMGNIHARELMAVEIPLRFAEYLLVNYGTDPDVTAMVDTRDIYIAPMLNPDGHVYVENNHAGDWWTWWRKNRRNNGGGSYGVDLNRNFSYEWGYDDVGSSPIPSSELYRGTAPFSEPETQAIESFCAAHDFTIAFSYHSYGDLLLYPWGYAYTYTVDHELFHTLGQRFTVENQYLAGNTAEGAIYITNGGSDDWAYGETLTKPSFLCFTPEVNTFEEGGFGPPESLIVPTFDETLPMNMRLLELADEPRKVLGPIAPVLSSVYGFDPPTLTLDWSGNVPSDPNPVASYEVEEFVNLGHVLQDDADALSNLWIYDGFTLSPIAYQGTGSYYGGYANDLHSTITTSSPYRVTPATQTFSCRMRYDIEQDWDYAYVQVSTDGGLIWYSVAGNVTTNLDPNDANRGNGITGSTGGAWVDAQFDLSAYVGQDVLLQILYVTDGSVLGDGIRVDVLGPVPSYDDRRTVAAAHPTNTIDIDVSEIATYTYRVRAQDADGDVGRWSNLVSIFLDPVTATAEVPSTWSHLSGNYPNPFNPSTLVSFTVGSEPGEQSPRVRLEIFDLAGRRVRGLVDAAMAPGNYRERWDGRDDRGRGLPSAIYVARLTVAGREAGVHKLTLLR
jgi:hypothetical protein